MNPLPISFFTRHTLDVARDLLGCLLVREIDANKRLVARIVETEGYTQEDPAFHGWRAVDQATGRLSKTGRAGPLFGEPGRAYIYRVYAQHWLFNIVTEPEGRAGAVLIRAAEMIVGEDIAWEHRPTAWRARDLANGPGKLTEAFGLHGSWHLSPLLTSPLYLAAEEVLPPEEKHPIATSTRIGLRHGIDLPWRYYFEGHPCVSPGKPSGG